MYLGKHIGENIETYNGSGVEWTKHLKEHKAKSIHIWQSEWFYDKSIVKYAKELSRENNITESDDWFNLKDEDGINGGGYGKKGAEKAKASLKLTVNDPLWKATKGVEKVAKQLATQSDDEWKSTVLVSRNAKISVKQLLIQNNPEWAASKGEGKKEKLKNIFNDTEWLLTKGVEKSNKISDIRNDPLWKATTGEEAKVKFIATMSDLEWQNTKGVEKKAKEKATKNTSEWIKANHRTCEYCGLTCLKGLYTRWHGNNCKSKVT